MVFSSPRKGVHLFPTLNLYIWKRGRGLGIVKSMDFEPSLPRPVIMVHTDTCFSYHGVKPFLSDTVDHRNECHIMIPLCTTFLCLAAAILVSCVNGSLRIRLHSIDGISVLHLIIAQTAVNYCEFCCVSNTIS